MTQNICKSCNTHPVTVNYVRNGKTYYRSICYYCTKEKKKARSQIKQLLKKSGYRKKAVCDRCNFVSKTLDQIKVHYRDGNLYNVSSNNLRSYCINCVIEVKNNPAADKRSIIADF
jgi:glutaredoxin